MDHIITQKSSPGLKSETVVYVQMKLKYVCLINSDKLPEDKDKAFEFEYVDIGNVTYEGGIIATETFKFKDAPSRARRLVRENDIIVSTVRTYLRAIDFIEGRKVNYVYSTGFAVLRPLDFINPKFLSYYIKSATFTNQVDVCAKGMSYPAINSSELGDLFVFVPPLEVQTRIANFLDDKCAKIDKAIAQKERLIELLKERKQILIHKAVTRGLNPNVKLKDSGVEWIGMVPEGWEVKKVKHLLLERTERSKDGSEPLLMMSQSHGLVVRSEYHEKSEVAKTSEGAKVVYPDDLVFNKLKAHLGVFFKSELNIRGIVSPDYAVYYSTGLLADLKFLELLFRGPEYIREFICRATGIVEGLIRLYTSDLFAIQVSFPPPAEQLEIIAFANSVSAKVNRSINLLHHEIGKVKEYKSSLIVGAVRGELQLGTS